MKKLRKISFSGIIVYGLTILILFIGFKDYQQQKLSINAKYDFQLNLANMSLTTEMASVNIDNLQLNLENDPTKKEIIKKEIQSKLQEIQIEKMSITEKINKQKEEELDARIFNLLSYVSLAITFFIFGVSLFWRKKDVINMEEQQDVILYNLNKQNHDIEQIKETLYMQNVALSNENQLLRDAYDKQIENSHNIVEKLNVYIKLIEETKKHIASAKEDDNCA
jgi:hypothetical protein